MDKIITNLIRIIIIGIIKKDIIIIKLDMVGEDR